MKLYIVLLTFTLYACHNSDASDEPQTKEIKVNIFEDSFGKANIQEVIRLENDEDAFLGRVARILVKESRIYILDRNRQKMMVFDRSGQHIHTINSGKGPGELTMPSDFEYDLSTQTLLIWDHSSKKLERYDHNLNHVETERTKSNVFIPWFIRTPDGNWLTYNNGAETVTPNGKDFYTFILLNSDMEPIRGLLPIDKSLQVSMVSYNPFSRKSKDEILMRGPRDYNIYRNNANQGNLEVRYKINFGLHHPPENSDFSVVRELFKAGKAVMVVGDVIHSPEYFALSTTFKARQEYFIYQKSSGKVRSSLAINDLPHGLLKGVIKGGTFILVVDPKEYLEFTNRQNANLPHIDGLKQDDNYLLVMFTID